MTVAAPSEAAPRSLAFVVGPRERFTSLARLVEQVRPGQAWDFVCLYEPETIPPGARVLKARRSLAFAVRLWWRAYVRPYRSVCVAGHELDRIGTAWVAMVAAALRAEDHAAVDPHGRTAAIASFTWARLFSFAVTVVLLGIATAITRVGMSLVTPSGPPRARGTGTAVLVPVLPDLSHTFVYREVLELKRRHPEYLVVALEQGDTSVMHREAAELLSVTEPMPKVGPNRYLLSYIGFWLRRPRATAGAITLFAPYSASFGHGRENDQYCLLRLEYLDHPNYIMLGLTLARFLEHRGIGYVHVYGATFPCARALMAYGLAGVRYSLSTFVDFDYATPFHMLREKMSGASFVVACTAYCANNLRQRFPSLSDRVFVIRHGLPAEYASGKRFRDRDGHSRLVYVGRFVPKKGLDVLVRACQRLKEWHVPFSCHLYGNGPIESDLRHQVTASGLNDVVRFEGPVPNEHFYGTMNEDDVFVCASRYVDDGERDGIPVSLMEAMAGGIAVVSTPVSGIPELIRDAENGYLVPSNDADALAATLRELILDPARRHAVCHRAVETVRQDFTIGAAVSILDDLLARAR